MVCFRSGIDAPAPYGSPIDPFASPLRMTTTPLLTFALLLLPAYFLGSIPFGLLVGRLRGLDIREHGSRNIGATNVWRTLGPRWGLFTFLLDAGKGFAAVTLARAIAFHQVPQPVPDDFIAYAEAFAGLACILGHSFPIWLRFRGGKGVATSLGVILSMMPPFSTAVVFAVWLLVFAVSRYVSLASLVAAVSLPVTLAILYYLRWMDSAVTLAFACAAAFLVIRRHRENIRRLIDGTENRFGSKTRD